MPSVSTRHGRSASTSAVGIGEAIGEAFSDHQPSINIAAGLAFRFFAASVSRFFLAELGDKTMLATITLLGRQLPEKAITYGASAAFVVFGLLLVWQGWTAL